MSPNPSSSTFSTPPSDIFTSISGSTLDTPYFFEQCVDDVVLLPLDFATNDRFSQYKGRLYEAPPPPPEPVPEPPPLPPRRELQVQQITGFKKIQSLPAVHLNGTPDAMERLVVLKQFINRLQQKRESYWRRQTITTGVGVGLAFWTFGGSALAGGAVAAYQGDRLDTIKAKIRQAIRQINDIRAEYGNEERWQEAEGMIRIDSDIFSVAISRAELRGSL